MADAAFAGDVARAGALLDQFGPWFDKYKGGMTAAWLASIMLHESGGNFNAPGDASLGELGYYQIAAYVPPLFGYDASARADPESNVAIAVLEYSLEAALWKLRYPDYVVLGSKDSWKLARLTFAVGRAGSYALADQAIAHGYTTAGDLYHSIVADVLANGAPVLGSQSSAKVIARVVDIDRQWAISEALGGGMVGPPTMIPDPPAGPYAIPANVVAYFSTPIPVIVWLIGAGAVGLAYLWSRR